MSASYRFLVRFNGYPLSAVIAVLLHGFTLGFILYWNSSSSSNDLELVQPTIIKSLFIDENPLTRERIERQQAQLQRDQEQRERELQRQRDEEQQRIEEEQRQREAEAEKLRQRQLEQQRLLDEEERRRLLELQRQREREQEERRQRELAEQQRRRQQEEAESRRRQEEAAAATARTEYEVMQSGVALIQQYVQEVWSRPPSARNGMRAVLRINLLPTGEVTDVAIAESSGDPAFDRSAENAVYRAQPFSELEQMPIHVFNENFRTLTLIFQPEDLLN